MINLGLCDLDQIYVLNKSVGLFRTITITNWVHCPPSRKVTTRTKMDLNTRCCTFFFSTCMRVRNRSRVANIPFITFTVWRPFTGPRCATLLACTACMVSPASRSQANFFFVYIYFQYCTQLNRLSSPFDHRVCHLSNHSESTGLVSSWFVFALDGWCAVCVCSVSFAVVAFHCSSNLCVCECVI